MRGNRAGCRRSVDSGACRDRIGGTANKRVVDGKRMFKEPKELSDTRCRLNRCTIVMKFQACSSNSILWYI